MNRDTEKTGQPTPKNNLTRNVGILMIVAFIGGAILMGWIFSRYNPFDTNPAPAVVSGNSARLADDPAAKLARRIAPDGTVMPPATLDDPASAALTTAALTPEKERALAVRVADLEDRLSRINVQAQAASGNASRAEGLLIAFAARRALDTGSPLGYIESQLRLRFGEAQPKAVTTIINASREPVTLEELASQLDDYGPALTSGSSTGGFWSNLQREMSELFVIRKDGTPSPAPVERLRRAMRFIENGNVDAAIGQVDKLPGTANDENAAQWLEKARRYNEARRALDVIETAAILEPQQLRASDVETITPPVAVNPIEAP